MTCLTAMLARRRPNAERPASSHASFYLAVTRCTTRGHGRQSRLETTPAAPFVRLAANENAGVQGHRSGPILAGPLAARYTGGMDTPEKRRWYCPTPGWLVLGSLAVTGLLFLRNAGGGSRSTSTRAGRC